MTQEHRQSVVEMTAAACPKNVRDEAVAVLAEMQEALDEPAFRLALAVLVKDGNGWRNTAERTAPDGVPEKDKG